jgi:hypothetical protein
MARDRKLARARRRREIDDARADERTRQRDSRARRTHAKATTEDAGIDAPGHAPASAPNSAESLKEIVRFVDRAFAVSRATLLRDLGRSGPHLREKRAKAGRRSRASFGGQGLDLPGHSGPILGRRHA